MSLIAMQLLITFNRIEESWFSDKVCNHYLESDDCLESANGEHRGHCVSFTLDYGF